MKKARKLSQIVDSIDNSIACIEKVRTIQDYLTQEYFELKDKEAILCDHKRAGIHNLMMSDYLAQVLDEFSETMVALKKIRKEAE